MFSKSDLPGAEAVPVRQEQNFTVFRAQSMQGFSKGILLRTGFCVAVLLRRP
jgi:hypothetical protein